MRPLIKSPLNYTGNKYRILEQMQSHFPEEIDCMVDLFCGGATVGLNVNARKVVFVDSNERIINLLVFLSKQTFEQFLLKCEEIINQYGLSYSYKYGYKFYRDKCQDENANNGLKDYNSKGFYRLREDYNSLQDKNSDHANALLYMLMVYAFNNDIRFNSDGKFNLPVGKTDLNKMNIEKIREYIERVKAIETEFICASFTELEALGIIDKADFVYMDPPYLIGNAVYNSSWGSQQEYALLDFIDSLIARKIDFALSNVIEKVGRTNEPLAYWCHKNAGVVDVHHIDYHYRGASYHKAIRNAKEQEVLITNKRYGNEN